MGGPTINLSDRICPNCGSLNISYSPSTRLFECRVCETTGYNFSKRTEMDAELKELMASEKIEKWPKRERPTIIYNGNHPAFRDVKHIALAIKHRFDGILKEYDIKEFDIFEASILHPFFKTQITKPGITGTVKKVLAPLTKNDVKIVLEIDFPGPEESGMPVGSIFETAEQPRKKHLVSNIISYVESIYPLIVYISKLFGDTYVVQYIYNTSPREPRETRQSFEISEVPESPKTHLIDYEAEAYARKLLNEKRDRGYVYSALLSKYRNKLLPAEIDRVFKAALLQIGEQNQPISWATRYRVCPKSGHPPHKSRGWKLWEKRFWKGDRSMIPIGVDEETGKEIYRCTICGYEEIESEKQKGKERKVTLPGQLPNLLILLIGMTLFGIEITTFGSGDYAMGSAGFIFGGGVIGFASWILDYRGKKKEQEENEEKNKGLAEVGAAVEPKKETTAAVPSYASMAGVLNKEEEE